jgi:SulP family sulfate permease
VANIVTGFLGGMGGCAVIGQTMINVKGSGARSRISTFLAGVFLLVLVVTLGGIVGLIPMAALVAVMIFVSAITFDWHSIAPRTLKRMPKSETAVMLITVVTVVATHNLAIGVGVGVLAAMAMFARRVAHFATVERTEIELNGETVATYTVDGELFFASSNDLYTQFEYVRDATPTVDRVIIDLHASHLWDASTIAVLDAVTEKYRRHGREVELIGLNSASALMRERLAGKLDAGH